MHKNIVVVRGGGDLATGTIHKLHRSGFKVLILEVPTPTAIRRSVSFSEAIYYGEMEIENVCAVHVHSLIEINAAWENKKIPIIIDESGRYIKIIKPRIVVDAIIAKVNTGMDRTMADITVALGPGFMAGKDVDVVIETGRGHNLGRLIFEGSAMQNTGVPGEIMGYSKERVIYSPCEGKMQNLADIGAVVEKGEVIAYINDTPITATIAGLLRGIMRNGSIVTKDFKIADIDPRVSEKMNCYTISDKARNIAGGVLEAILFKNNQRREGE